MQKSTFILCVISLSLLIIIPNEVQANSDFTLYLVRHAQKAAMPKKDPELTEAGHRTAKAFANFLQNKSITRVFSTDYKRTRQTAEHFAKSRKMLVQKYNPRELETFAKRLLDASETTYIVGHSNTTPTLIALLGGIANPINDGEYGKIYQLKFVADKIETTVIPIH